jgi:hypothetical protein
MRRRAAFALVAALAAGVLLRRRQRSAAPGVDSPPAPAATLAPVPRFLSLPWELAEPAGDDAELAVRFARSEQMALDRVDVRETPTQVFVTVLVRWEPPAGGWFAWDVEETATVALAAPLGERELVHAATDAEAPLYP